LPGLGRINSLQIPDALSAVQIARTTAIETSVYPALRHGRRVTDARSTARAGASMPASALPTSGVAVVDSTGTPSN